MIRLLVATLVALFTLGIASPVTTYLPAITGHSNGTPPVPAVPSPYNVQAQEVVLQAEDMSSEFQLDKSEAMTFSDEVRSWGAVSAYQTQFSNQPAQPSALSKVESAAVVFLTVAGANQAYDAEVDYKEQEGIYTRITAPAYGDESAAFQANGSLNGQPIEQYYLFFYKGNVWVAIRIEGAADLTELADAEPYIQKVLEKIQ
jgi:hypothetical protein